MNRIVLLEHWCTNRRSEGCRAEADDVPLEQALPGQRDAAVHLRTKILLNENYF